MLVKVCGLNDSENIQKIDSLAPSMLGMIFYAASPRYMNITPMVITKTPKVGVFVNEEINTILSYVNNYELEFVQLHGSESVYLVKELYHNTIKIIKSFHIDDESCFLELKEYEPYCNYFLFDTKGQYFGGNGYPFDWSLLKKYTLSTPFLLSGGISINDIDTIKNIRHSQFAGIDINSKFEIQAGIKDINLVKKMIHAFK